MTEENKGINSGMAALIGAIAGATAAVGAIALSDEKTRKNIEGKLKIFAAESLKAWQEIQNPKVNKIEPKKLIEDPKKKIVKKKTISANGKTSTKVQKNTLH